MRGIRTVLRTVVFAAVAGAMAMAQTAPAPGPQNPPARHARARMGARRGINQTLMASYLGLTADQQAKAKAIHDSAREQAKTVVQQLRQVKQQLSAAVQAGQPVDSLAAQQGQLMGQLIGIRANARVQFRKLLTPEQLQKLDQLRSNQQNG